MELDAGQIKAVERLRNGSVLVGGVGSGKSRTALTYFFCKECKGVMPINRDGTFVPMKEPKDLVIITTAKKRDTGEWEEEMVPFKLYPVNKAPIKITIDSWQNLPKYANVMNSFFIFDEQRLVGYGKWTKTFLRIAKCNHWILLTATPADKWEDLAPVFIANGFYEHITEFRTRHCIYNPHVEWRQVSRYINTGRLIKLRKMIYVEIEYDNEHSQHHSDILVDYNKELYKFVTKERWDPYNECPIDNISQLCYILRRIINTDPSRIEASSKIIQECPRLVIFYNFDYELEILRELAKELEVPKAEWNGHIHQPVPDSAQWLYLVQYTAGAEGWNCTTTNSMLFYSQNYSYRTMIQAAGRIDRRNTPYKDLYYYKLVSQASLDTAISKALKNKKRFNESSFIYKSLKNSQKKHSI